MKEEKTKMKTEQYTSKFETLEVALEVIAALADGVLEEIKRKDKNLGEQLDRASVSTALNLAEGARRSGRDRANRYAIAYGEAYESRTALRCAQAKRLIEDRKAQRVDAVMDRLAAMLWKLTRARR